MCNTKFEFYLRLKDHAESTFARAIDVDLEEWQVRRECMYILNTYEGDCPVGVDVYKNGEFCLSENVED